MSNQNINDFLLLLEACLRKHVKGQDPFRPHVYIPSGASINFSNKLNSAPKTMYNDRQMTYDRDSVKILVGGRYGQN